MSPRLGVVGLCVVVDLICTKFHLRQVDADVSTGTPPNAIGELVIGMDVDKTLRRSFRASLQDLCPA
jgi:hypothetical protein